MLQLCPKGNHLRVGVCSRKPPNQEGVLFANTSKKRGFTAAWVVIGSQAGSEPCRSTAEEACGGFVFVPGPMLLMQMLELGASLLAAAALCCSSYWFLHMQLFLAFTAMSFGLNTVTNDKQFKVKCLDVGQTFPLLM